MDVACESMRHDAAGHRGCAAMIHGRQNAGGKSGVAAVDRALAIPRAFAPGDGALSLAQLAARTGFYKSTILRLATSLEKAAYLVRLDNGKWRLGPAFSRFGALYQASFNLCDHVGPVLRGLAAASGESVSFYVREGDVRVCLFRIDSSRPMYLRIRAGDHLPLDRGAAGRILLAFAEGVGDETDRIRRELACFSRGDRDPHGAAVAAPVFKRRQALVGALAISGHATRFDDAAVARATGLVRAAAADLTRCLGGDPSVFAAAGVAPNLG